MIDSITLIVNALWVLGLSLALAALSLASFRAAEAGDGLAAQIQKPGSMLAIATGLALFCLGRSLISIHTWWQALLWLLLAVFFTLVIWQARERRKGREGDLRVGLRAWARGSGPTVLLLISLSVVLAVMYAATIRPWMQPDEPRHFEVALHVARLGQPVVYYPDHVQAWQQEIIADMEAQSFWWYGYSLIGWDPNNLPQSFDEIFGPLYGLAFFQQPLYYAFTGTLLQQFGADWPLSTAVMRLRAFNIVLLALSLWGIYRIIRELFPTKERLALVVLAVAALWPSHIASHAAVNNDPLVEVFAVWALYFGVKLIRHGPALSDLTLLLLFGLGAMAAKRSGLVALALFPMALLLWALGLLAGQWSWRRVLGAVMVIVVTVLAAAALGLTALRSGRLHLPKDFTEALLRGDYWQEIAQAPLAKFADALLRTFIGWFGWLRVPLIEPAYWLGALLLVVALIGLLVLLFSKKARRAQGWQKRILLLFAAALLLQFGLVIGKEMVFSTWQDGSIPQSRYLYPVMPAIMFALILGLGALLPAQARKYALPAVVVVMFLVNAYILGFVLYPFFWL